MQTKWCHKLHPKQRLKTLPQSVVSSAEPNVFLRMFAVFPLILDANINLYSFLLNK